MRFTNSKNKKLRRILILVCAAVMIFALAPTAFAAGSTLKVGSSGSDVTTLQNRLLDLGYMDYGNATGYFGPVTKAAVVRFQNMNGLSADGIVGPLTNDKLYSSSAKALILSIGSSGEAVSALQTKLMALGYYTYPNITGYYGSVTKAAVASFQKAYGLSADGIAGPVTRKALFSNDANGTSTALVTSAAKIADTAMAQLGKPYVYSTEGPDTFDCSGLAYYSMIQAGYSVERLSAAGFSENAAWAKITGTSSLQKGDLIFFRSDDSSYISHMGIYVGGGEFVQASSGQGKVMTSELSNSYWARNYMFARRVS